MKFIEKYARVDESDDVIGCDDEIFFQDQNPF